MFNVLLVEVLGITAEALMIVLPLRLLIGWIKEDFGKKEEA